jgi:hypothetical protein
VCEQLPGSLRITSLVGVGGWRNEELAVTGKALNKLGLASLPDLVDALSTRIRQREGQHQQQG